MEFNQIRYVLSVAETHNFSRAADLLFITQPTLSQQISKLEQELGIDLFDRTTRSVQLTEAGAAFVKEAKAVVAAWEKLLQTTQHYKTIGITKILVGLLPTLGRTNLVECISEFSAAYTNVQIELITSYSYELLQKLHSHEIDIGILNTLPFPTKTTDSLDVYQLEENPIMVIMNKHHPLAKQKTVTLEDIQGFPTLALNINASVRVCMDKVFEKNRIKPHVVCECDIETLSDLVSANMGISFLTARVAVNQHNIHAVPLYPPVTTYTSIVTRNEKHEKPLISKFRDHIIKAFTP